jgi:hypothetical protein
MNSCHPNLKCRPTLKATVLEETVTFDVKNLEVVGSAAGTTAVNFTLRPNGENFIVLRTKEIGGFSFGVSFSQSIT